MSKRIKFVVIIILFMLIASIGTNIYLGVRVNQLSKANNGTQRQLDEMKLKESIEENEISENDNSNKDGKNNEINQEESKENSQNRNNSTNDKTTSSPNMNKQQSSTTNNNNNNNNKNKHKKANELVGKWQYVNGEDVTTYVFKEDGTLWINDEYIDKYTDNSAICDNCLTHIGLHEIQYMIKDGLLYINFYKETQKRINVDGTEESKVYYLISRGSYVKAKRIN